MTKKKSGSYTADLVISTNMWRACTPERRSRPMDQNKQKLRQGYYQLTVSSFHWMGEKFLNYDTNDEIVDDALEDLKRQWQARQITKMTLY